MIKSRCKPIKNDVRHFGKDTCDDHDLYHSSQKQRRETLPLPKLEEILPKLYLSFQDTFSKESFNELPERKQWDHTINLKPESQPFSTKVYPMSPIEQQELDDFLEENLLSGQIHPSKSPMASPVLLHEKERWENCDSSRTTESSMR